MWKEAGRMQREEAQDGPGLSEAAMGDHRGPVIASPSSYCMEEPFLQRPLSKGSSLSCQHLMEPLGQGRDISERGATLSFLGLLGSKVASSPAPLHRMPTLYSAGQNPGREAGLILI
jgi:hypothetical protein